MAERCEPKFIARAERRPESVIVLFRSSRVPASKLLVT